MFSLLLCSDNVLNSVDIQYMQGTHHNTITMTTKQKSSIKKTKQWCGGKQKQKKAINR